MNANAFAAPPDDSLAPVVLRGTNRGLEIVIAPGAGVEEIDDALVPQLEKSPSFFAGNDVTICCEGPLPRGCLGPLEEIATRFDLRIVAVGPAIPAPRGESEKDAAADDGEPEPGAAPEPDLPTEAAAPAAPAAAAGAEATAGAEAVAAAAAEAGPEPAEDAPRIVVGPIRSGVILEAAGDLVILGDVNPGAEVLAGGDIIVLGTLRGVAHAACRRDRGFILALTLKPQQLRIGRLIARAGDADSPAGGAEIAFVHGGHIEVDAYKGRLPGGLATARL